MKDIVCEQGNGRKVVSGGLSGLAGAWLFTLREGLLMTLFMLSAGDVFVLDDSEEYK